MSGTPTYFSPAQVYYAGLSGSPTTVSIPWVTSFDQLQHREQVCILNNDLNPMVPAGLYVQMPVVGPNNSVTMQWKLGLAIADVNTVSSNLRTFKVVVNQSTTTVYDSTYSVWKNGVVEADYTVTPSTTAIWIVASNTGSGQGGGISSIASASDYVSTIVTPLASKIGIPVPYTAATNTPALASGVAPATGAQSSYQVADTGVVAMQSAISADVPAVRAGDWIYWSPALSKWVRAAGDPFTIAVSGALTLTAAHNQMTLVLATSQALTVNTGLPAGFGVILIGPYTLAGTATIGTDKRISGGDAATMSVLVNNGTTDTYQQFGGKL